VIFIIDRIICKIVGHTKWGIGRRQCERCGLWLKRPLAAGERYQDQFGADTVEKSLYVTPASTRSESNHSDHR
jgi:hypothetical protein